MFGRSKKEKTFDREKFVPVIRASICTGEKTAGFQDIHTKHFTEVMLIRNDRDLKVFLDRYGLTEDEVTTLW